MLTSIKKSQHSLAFSFWLITALLLLIYLWTLTETVPIAVQVQDDFFAGAQQPDPLSEHRGGRDRAFLNPYYTGTESVEQTPYFFAPGAA